MNEHSRVTVINRMTGAVLENDRDTLSQILTEDLGFHVRGPLPCAGDHTGVDGFLGALGALFELTAGDLKIEQLFCVAGDRWAAEWEQAQFGRNGRRLEAHNAGLSTRAGHARHGGRTPGTSGPASRRTVTRGLAGVAGVGGAL